MTISGSSIVTEVEKFKGFPYIYGDTGPSAFDCSGLVQYVLTTLGVQNVPRTSEAQWAWAQHIDQSQLEPGDLVFAQFPGDDASPGHVGVYTGNGQVLSAEDPAQGVGYSTLDSWSGNIVGYGRVPGSSTSPDTSDDASTTATGQDPSTVQDTTGLIKDAGTLLHDTAEMLNFFFEFMHPGQQWRAAMGIGGVIAGGIAASLYTGTTVSLSSGRPGLRQTNTAGRSDTFPVAVLLTGVAACALYMAFRPWPTVTEGSGSTATQVPVRVAPYAVDILSGHAPSPGTVSNDTKAIEVGLGAFAAIWGASKVAGVASGAGGILSNVANFFKKYGSDAEEGAEDAGEGV